MPRTLDAVVQDIHDRTRKGEVVSVVNLTRAEYYSFLRRGDWWCWLGSSSWDKQPDTFMGRKIVLGDYE